MYKQQGITFIGYFYNDKKHGYGAYFYLNNSCMIGKWMEDIIEGLAILIDQNKDERIFLFKKDKNKLPINDINQIRKIKNDIEYLNLKIYLEELKVKGLYN